MESRLWSETYNSTRLFALLTRKRIVIHKLFCTFAAVITHLMRIIMSEKQKQVEKERRGVLELLLQKNGLKRKELVDFLLGVWMAGKVGELTEEEKAQFPNLVF